VLGCSEALQKKRKKSSQSGQFWLDNFCSRRSQRRKEMPAVDKFVARLNIGHFRNKLAVETDEANRGIFSTLLAEEEAKLAALENDSPGDNRRLASKPVTSAPPPEGLALPNR
jgi:hypothetical protein